MARPADRLEVISRISVGRDRYGAAIVALAVPIVMLLADLGLLAGGLWQVAIGLCAGSVLLFLLAYFAFVDPCKSALRTQIVRGQATASELISRLEALSTRRLQAVYRHIVRLCKAVLLVGAIGLFYSLPAIGLLAEGRQPDRSGLMVGAAVALVAVTGCLLSAYVWVLADLLTGGKNVGEHRRQVTLSLATRYLLALRSLALRSEPEVVIDADVGLSLSGPAGHVLTRMLALPAGGRRWLSFECTLGHGARLRLTVALLADGGQIWEEARLQIRLPPDSPPDVRLQPPGDQPPGFELLRLELAGQVLEAAARTPRSATVAPSWGRPASFVGLWPGAGWMHEPTGSLFDGARLWRLIELSAGSLVRFGYREVRPLGLLQGQASS